MKFRAFTLACAALSVLAGKLTAQNSDAATLAIREAIRRAEVIAKPMPDAERDKVLQAASTILNRLVTFNGDGTARTVHHWNNQRIHLEWQDLRLGKVSRSAMSEADGLNGITKRYTIAITAKSHRRWDVSQNRWSEWKAVGYSLFPSHIALIERNDNLEHAMTLHGSFGNGLPRAGSKIEPQPQALPSGMQRSR